MIRLLKDFSRKKPPINFTVLKHRPFSAQKEPLVGDIAYDAGNRCVYVYADEGWVAQS